MGPWLRQHATQSLDIAVIGGDGIGPEVVAEGLKVLSAVTADGGPKVTTTDYDLGARRWHATGETLPDSVLEEIRGHDAILLGAVGDPGVPSGVLERGLLLRLRFALDHYVNLRPARLYPGVASPLDVERVAPDGIDFVVVREGTEGPYAGNGGALRVGTPARDRDRGQRQHPRSASSASCATPSPAPRPARAGTSRSCTSTTCSRTPATCGAAPSRRSGAEFPDVETDYLHVDAATIFLATDPGRFDVIVTDNLFGDILTDIAAAIAGGIGLAASGNINPDRTAPEHVRAGARLGSRHRRPGQGRPDRDDPVGRRCCSSTSGLDDEAARVEARRRRRPRRARRRRVRSHRRGRRRASPPERRLSARRSAAPAAARPRPAAPAPLAG